MCGAGGAAVTGPALPGTAQQMQLAKGNCFFCDSADSARWIGIELEDSSGSAARLQVVTPRVVRGRGVTHKSVQPIPHGGHRLAGACQLVSRYATLLVPAA